MSCEGKRFCITEGIGFGLLGFPSSVLRGGGCVYVEVLVVDNHAKWRNFSLHCGLL